jgi:hypothetical protein
MKKEYQQTREGDLWRTDLLKEIMETNAEVLTRMSRRGNVIDMNDLTLTSLVDIMNTTYAKEEARWLRVDIQIPGQDAPEHIFNPRSNFEPKLLYYINAYNQDLTLKANPDIRIIGYELTTEDPF